MRDCSVQYRCLYWVNRLLAGADRDLMSETKVTVGEDQMLF